MTVSAATTPVRRWRALATLVALIAPLIALLTRGPIAQDQAYHAFAGDGAGWIPNFWNVATNAPFLAIGVVGLWLPGKPLAGSAQLAWKTFFAATALVAFGSAYYHWSPNDAALVWDRLPITVAFMSLFVALVAENIEPRWERTLLAPAIVVGIASVAWWNYSGDLRVYLAVQGGALLAIPVILALYPPRFTHRCYFVYGLVLYALAKLAEVYDRAFFDFVAGAIGGHPVKHLLAAAAPLYLWLMLRRRRALDRSGGA